MTDPRPPESRPTKPTRNIPPLVWILLAILVGWFALTMIQRGGTHVTPSGGETPMAKEETTVMPAAPAIGDAPATPANVGDSDSSRPAPK